MRRIVGLNVGLGLVDRRLSRLGECFDRKLRVAPALLRPEGPNLRLPSPFTNVLSLPRYRGACRADSANVTPFVRSTPLSSRGRYITAGNSRFLGQL